MKPSYKIPNLSQKPDLTKNPCPILNLMKSRAFSNWMKDLVLRYIILRKDWRWFFKPFFIKFEFDEVLEMPLLGQGTKYFF